MQSRREMMAAKWKGLMWIVAAACVAGISAIELPLAAKHIPWSIEQSLAKVFGTTTMMKPCDGRGFSTAAPVFNVIIERLYPHYPADKRIPLSIEAVAGETVNAFATLGGKIYVYDGLIQQADSAEELAAVLAHEIEHVSRRHIIQGVFVQLVTAGFLNFMTAGDAQWDVQILKLFLGLKFTSEQEYEADLGGLKRLQDAEIDVSGFRRFFERPSNKAEFPEMLSDHPSHGSRAELVRKFEGKASRPLLTNEQWSLLKQICH